jgi:hypothetical protein
MELSGCGTDTSFGNTRTDRRIAQPQYILQVATGARKRLLLGINRVNLSIPPHIKKSGGI